MTMRATVNSRTVVAGQETVKASKRREVNLQTLEIEHRKAILRLRERTLVENAVPSRLVLNGRKRRQSMMLKAQQKRAK